MCSCNSEEECSTHYLLRCPNFFQLRNHLMNKINIINPSLHLLNDDDLSKILLFGDSDFDSETNTKILNLTIDFIHISERFNIQLF